MKIDAKTDLYCIFGNPVRHSLSPQMHNTAFKKFEINARYLAFEPENSEKAIDAMRILKIKGASVTIPFKVEIAKFVDKLDPLAKDIGSVNTLKNVDGLIVGYNTDGIGAKLALEESGHKIKNLRVLILGNGGGGRAIAFTLLEAGAKVAIAGRNIEKVSKLTSDLFEKHKEVKSILISDLSISVMEEIDVIINSTPIGMHPKEGLSLVSSSLIKKNHTVFDIIYSPEMTKLLLDANRIGAKIIKGKEMLVNQGVEQFRIWTGKKVSTKFSHKALRV